MIEDMRMRKLSTKTQDTYEDLRRARPEARSDRTRPRCPPASSASQISWVDRPDGVINLCEMKWSGAPFVIDKRYAGTLRERTETFRRVTGTRKSLFLTFVTARSSSGRLRHPARRE
jgi:hypothetical protein